MGVVEISTPLMDVTWRRLEITVHAPEPEIYDCVIDFEAGTVAVERKNGDHAGEKELWTLDNQGALIAHLESDYPARYTILETKYRET